MKIALAQMNYTIGDFEANKMKIIGCVNQAKAQGVDLLVFSEQAVSGAPAYDLLNKVSFLDLCEDSLVEIASYCDNISVLVGMPAQSTNNKTISVAALIEDRKIKRYVGKKTIDSRDELFHLSPSKGCEYIKIRGTKVAVVVGSDIKTEQEYGDYADIIVNLCNSHYMRGCIENRYDFYRRLAFMTGKTVVYVNNVGGQTDVIYDGSSAVFNSRGEALALLKSFEEDFQVIDLNADVPPCKIPEQNKTINVYRAIKLGLGDFFRKNGFLSACIGLSGGIDSAVVAALAAEGLGPENVHVLLMPSQFSSDHSVDDARILAENLGARYQIVPITQTFATLTQTLGPIFGELPFDVTEENMQARLRGMMLMALSNKFGHILLNTSNKSESAVGYGTLYGDSVGAISIIGDLYKSEVYDLARYINRLSDAVYALARLQEDLTQEERLRAQVTALVRKQLSAPEGGLPPFSLASLQRMAQRAVERAGQLGVPVVFSAVDSGGNLVLLQRMEGALLGSVDVSAGKAYTANAFQMPTHELGQAARPDGPLYGIDASAPGKIVLFGGGFPYVVNGKVVGGIGVSGGTVEQDMDIARYAMSL